MRPSRPILWAALFSCLWTLSLAGVKELRLPVPTSETIAAVAREMGAATYQESLEELDQDSAASESRRVQRKLVTGGEDIEDNTEYQEYQGVMGRPGVDFPVLPNIPTTGFSCRAVKKPGYYADLDTDCQVFHICDGGRKISFLCPNGTIFRQSHLICDWWFRVDCGKSVELYEESAEQLANDQRIYKERAEALTRAINKGDQEEQQRDTFSTQREQETSQPSSPKPDTHIDAPFFANAKLNYENRQSARKQQAFQQRRQPRPQAPQVESIHFESQNGNQLQYKNSEDIRTNKPVDEEKEQQVLSETASFASSRGNKFGRQFFQENIFTPSSQPGQASTLGQGIQPNFIENNFQSNSKAPITQSSLNFRTSTTVSDSFSNVPSSTSSLSFSPEVVYQTSTTSDSFIKPSTESSIAPQRNIRPSGRLLPTSSQNSNLRQNPSRNNLFRSNKQTSTTKNFEVSYQTSPDVSITTPSTTSQFDLSSPQNNINPNSFSFVPQKNFVRPSPDLTPPEQSPTSRQTQRIQAQAHINQNSKTYVQLQRNRTPSSSTLRGPVVESSVNRFSSPTTIPPVPETTTSQRQRQKQRRFTSTTQKPVFTVKFRPSKSFSYVELERSRGQKESSTQPTISTPTQPSFSPLIDTHNKVENVHFRFNDNSQEQFSSTPLSNYATSNTPDPRPNTKGSTFTFSTYSSTPSYSPTIPEHFSSNKINNTPHSKQTTSSISNNEDVRLDKVASFSNIDPAEINLLPSSKKSVTRNKLRVPDSSGPNALHTLALYYATSESDSGTTPAYYSEDTFPPQSEEILENISSTGNGGPTGEGKDILKTQPKQKHKISDEILLRSHSGSPDNEAEIDNVKATVESTDAVKDISTVLTKATKDSYASLFNDTEKKQSHNDGKPCTGDDVYDLDLAKEAFTEKDVEIKDDLRNDLDIQQSRGIVQPTSSTKKPTTLFSSNIDDLPDELRLRDSTDLRELAQVFSRALSAYLEDPDSFRRILSEVRPTEPTSAHTSETTQALEENEDEVLDFSDASSTGPRLITNNQIPISNQNVPINSIDIEEINGLAQDNITGPSADLILRTKAEENPEVQVFTTANPTSLAVDINYLLSDTNSTSFESVTEDSYFPTAEMVEDKSRWGRYGGFHNNSAVSEYQPYGSEVSDTVTGRPITESTFVTDGPSLETTLYESENVLFSNKNVSTAASNQIDIESIPDQLGIVPAHDINSLVEDHRHCDDPSHNHDNSQGSDILDENKPFLIQTEEEIYGRGTDQEKVLIASGSQSFVSRDNYIRILGKQEFDSKNSVASKTRKLNENNIKISESTPTTQKTPTTKSRGSVRFGPPSTADRSDISSFRRRPNKEITFQNVNLGNGVTLERTKTVRYSTPEIQNIRVSTFSPDTNINPILINEQLGLVREEVVATTESPFQTSGSTVSIIRATTYHPSSSYKPDFPDAIPPRGSLRNSWQWNTRPSSKADITTPENFINTILNNGNFDSSPQDFSTFASTLLPPNMTLESAKEEMLEKKAEEIFGKLNETSANMLMNVMNQAESNTTMRRLVLLLVADRNGRDNKSFEESRNQLIQALLKTTVPDPTTSGPTQTTQYKEEKKTTTKKAGRTRSRPRSSSTSSTTTTTQISTTSRSRSPKAYRGTDPDIKTTSSDDTFEKPEPQYLRSPNLFPQNPSASSFGSDPDARAVELLKSLYHLAARWG